MGAIVQCPKCMTTDRYRSDEIKNSGTMFHYIWTAECKNCGFLIKSDQKKDEFYDDAFYFPMKDGRYGFDSPMERNTHKQKKGRNIKEYWVQEYVNEKYKKLGFSRIEGPYKNGPDFKGVYKDKDVIIEVETDWRSYIEHKHHKDSNFKDVSILIVLSPDEPPKEMKKKLPKKIIYIDIDDFMKWRQPKAKKFAEGKRSEGKIKLLSIEFEKRWVEDCDDKDRDMATCPNCDLCSYFGEGIPYGAVQLFNDMAHKFIQINELMINEDFKISDIDPSQIDKFYNEHILNFL